MQLMPSGDKLTNEMQSNSSRLGEQRWLMAVYESI